MTLPQFHSKFFPLPFLAMPLPQLPKKKILFFPYFDNGIAAIGFFWEHSTLRHTGQDTGLRQGIWAEKFW